MKLRPYVGVALMAALAACTASPQTPLMPSTTQAAAPGQPAVVLPEGVMGDGQVYPDGHSFRLLAVEELPIVGVAASSSSSGFAPSRMVDGDLSTQWVDGGYRNVTSSATVELAASASIGSIDIKTGPSPAGTSYDVQVSADGAGWTTARSGLTNTSWNPESKALPAGTTGKFVRILWHNSASAPQPHFSIFELNVNGVSAGTPSPSPIATASPTPPPASAPPTTPPTGTEVKVAPTSVTASSTYSGLTPQRAIDGSLSTQWANGGYKDASAWLSLAFADTQTFSSLHIKTGALPAGVGYVVEVSGDGTTWSAASGAMTNTTWNMETKAISGQGRFLRVRFTNSPSSPVARFSLYEIEAYGRTVTDPTMPIAATPDVNEAGSRIAFNSNANENLVVWNRMAVDGVYAVQAQRLKLDGTRVGDRFDIFQGTNQVRDADVVFNPTANEYLVVWTDSRASTYEVYAQRVSAAGGLVGEAFALSVEPENNVDSSSPRITYNSAANEYLVAWFDSSSAPVRARRLSASGASLGDSFSVGATGGTKFELQVAASAHANGYLVAWSEIPSGSGFKRIQTQRLTSSGAAAGDLSTISSSTHDLFLGDLTFNWQANEYLITYFTELAGNQQIRAQRMADAGAFVGDPFNLTDEGDNLWPAVAYNGHDNEYVVVWSHAFSPTDDDGSSDLAGLRFSAVGAPIGAPFVVCDAHDFQMFPDILYNFASDTYMATWDDDRDAQRAEHGGPPNQTDTYGRVFE